ncbi:substrate-binding domain-containing protein [Gaetbulibacter aquiaggeris]|uniref:Substrate-binding domain-containing protein n=1 Tax=Gaetbulibacter aquiaggeris TaxID=1735373 RepID=A0ABW7MSA1_9FLAO
MTRIKDIAREANVSEGTIDRVIHNRGGVSKKTEIKIKEILKKRNFTLNPVASALARQKKYKIAVLIPEFSESDIFWELPNLGILKAIDDIKSLGVEVAIFKYEQYSPQSYKKSFDLLLKGNPSAVIFVPMFLKETSKIVNQLKKLQIKYFFLNIDFEEFENSIFIGQNSYMAGFISGKLMHLSVPEEASFLILQSKHQVGDNNAISKRIEGFKNYFKTHKIEVEILLLNIANFSDIESTRKKINNFLDKHSEIKGLFIPSSRISHIVSCLSDLHIKQLKLIGFDNTPQNIECLKNGDVSFLISQKPFDQGYESILLMKDYLLKDKLPKDKIYLPIDILIKENVMFNERIL